MESWETLKLLLGGVVIFVAILAIVRRVDVRLVLFVAAMALGGLSGQIMPIVRQFFATFSNERFVVPICTAMGFAYVLRLTKCDQHLVHFLVKPLSRVRWALIPGTVLVGFLVNIPIISQTSTAASIGPVIIPILRAARLSPITIGAALLLGCSIGGELLNPGAPELRTTIEESNKAIQRNPNVSPDQKFVDSNDVVRNLLPLDILGLLVATCVFWFISSRAEQKWQQTSAAAEQQMEEVTPDFKVNLVKAGIPLLPLLLLFLTGPPLNLIKVPHHWLVPGVRKAAVPSLQAALSAAPQGGLPGAMPWSIVAAEQERRKQLATQAGLYGSRLIGTSMLIGVLVAAIVSFRLAPQVPKAFFEGAGYAFANIVSLIVTASCFGVGIRVIGIAALVGNIIEAIPVLLVPASGALPMGFATLCGSGMASTQALFGFFAEPSLQQNVDPTLVGSVVSLGSAAGRTMSPVAAVVLMTSTLSQTNPFDLVKRVSIPLILGVVAVIIAAFFMTL